MWNPFKKPSNEAQPQDRHEPTGLSQASVSDQAERQEPVLDTPRAQSTEPLKPLADPLEPPAAVTLNADHDEKAPPLIKPIDDLSPLSDESTPEVHTPTVADPVPVQDTKPETLSKASPSKASSSQSDEAAAATGATGLGASWARKLKSNKPKQPDDPQKAQARRVMRQRLVGLALILLTVVLASSFFLDDEKQVKEVVMERELPQVPAAMDKEREATLTPVVPVAEQTKSKADSNVSQAPDKADSKPETKPAAKAEPQTKAEQPAKEQAASKTQSDPLSAALAEVEKKEKAKTQDKSQDKSMGSPQPGTYVVQVMVTGDEKKAQLIVNRLRKAKLPAYYESLNGSKWRIRVGAFKTEGQANDAQSKMILNNLVNGLDKFPIIKL